MFAHIPGIRLVIPSTPARAYSLLRAAIRDPDPVVLLEPKRIYRATRENVGAEEFPLDQSLVERFGKDVTLAGWAP